VTAADIDHVVPHQANIRIVEAACERLGLPMAKTFNVLDRTGNTSAASIPLALVDALDRGRIHDGDLLLLVGFGAGMAWGSVVLRWGGSPERRRAEERP
jgi:3-oxoacyl-[acyl-carrier-protein] synthase-3